MTQTPSRITRARLLALLCLTSIVMSWVPHSHAEHESSGATAHAVTEMGALAVSGEQVSSDDAHEEHSSHSSVAAEICAVCRSHGERQFATHAAPGAVVAAPALLRSHVDEPRAQSRGVFAGLAPLRGPPISLL